MIRHKLGQYTFQEATNLLHKIKPNPRKVVDLGAGKRDSPVSEQIKKLRCEHLVSVEAFEAYLPHLLHGGNSAKTHDVVHAHIVHSNYKVPECDVVLMIDVIEHLKKEDALELLEYLKTKANQIVLFTPEGDTIGYSSGDMGNVLQEHLSAWTPESLEALGFEVEVFEDFHTHVKDYPIGVIWAIWNKDVNG